MIHPGIKPFPTQKPPVGFMVRPWGSQKQYAHNQEVTVTLIVLSPGHRLSLQSHANRAELWIVLDEGAVIQVGEEVLHPKPGDEIWIPAGVRHRLSNTGVEVRVLEVGFGDWQQVDITRFQDDYGRPEFGE
jgi:mannose-1-phosphate guanylyltransferase/mannose-6-phosphate isomerase